jgi:hypothetical protein
LFILNKEEFKNYIQNNLVSKEGYFEAILSEEGVKEKGLEDNIESFCEDLGWELWFEEGEYRITIPDFNPYENLIEMCIEEAKTEIENEMKRLGFIDDSDDCQRFLDSLCRKLIENNVLCYSDNENSIFQFYNKDIKELSEDLLQKVRDEIMSDYNTLSETDERGHTGYVYYEIDKQFKNFDEFDKYFGLGE